MAYPPCYYYLIVAIVIVALCLRNQVLWKDSSVLLLARYLFFWITEYHLDSYTELLNCRENHRDLGFMPGRSTAGDQLKEHATTVLQCPFGPVPH